MTTPNPGRPRTAQPKGLFYTALAFFFVGVAAIVAMFVVSAATDGPPGLALYLVALACPVGFVLAIVYALRSGRRSR
ncbi:hypothetical protein [Rhodococcus sp. HNM0569]|uniref:hypothetical protein n=1 Tax=Rhodococcus sp. HNM0569 TaxID=2716340 RepID=UPI001469BD12|nr:hypothetical protein [Rhodococcus sp. HNM0569]NLU82425.1 hypothetical protein [Rhodococcus sp. HNM0569]